MSDAATITVPTPPDLHRFLGRVIFRLRWATLAVVLFVALILPASGRLGVPTWLLVVAFAAHNLVMDILRRRLGGRFSFRFLTVGDLLLAGGLYLLGADPGGPLFVLLVLAVDSAAATLNLRGTLAYTGVVAALAGAIDLTIGFEAPTPADLRLLCARLVVLALLGAAMAILTRRLALEQAIAHAAHDEAERLASVGRIRADFIATVSHELRTPLTSAGAAMVLLNASASERHTPDEQKLLDNARRNIERLSLLIDDLLTHNQLEAGTFQLDRQQCDLRAVVADAASAVHPLLQEKHQELEIDLPEPLPMLGDSSRLEQVIVNLLANAHQHTPPGTRIVISGCLADGAVRLKVRDTGPGIPGTELEHIFQRFYRLGDSDNGTGLGLAIARRLVQLHDGRVWAESQAGAGTIFCIDFPSVAHGALA